MQENAFSKKTAHMIFFIDFCFQYNRYIVLTN